MLLWISPNEKLKIYFEFARKAFVLRKTRQIAFIDLVFAET